MRVFYIFEIRQLLLFRISDSTGRVSGEIYLDLSTILMTPSPAQFRLRSPDGDADCGDLIIDHQPVEHCMSVLSARVTSSSLKSMHSLLDNDPFYEILNTSLDRVFVSPIDREMRWPPFSLNLQILCQLNQFAPFRIRFFDHRRFESHVLIGEYAISVRETLEVAGQVLNLTARDGSLVGNLMVTMPQLRTGLCLYDYLRSQFQIALITAIDFTASSGPQSSPHSLHYRTADPAFNNAFDYAIRAVGDVLVPYNADEAHPVLGFGARVDGEYKYCFALSENPADVKTVDDILGVYHEALENVELAAPSNCAQVVRWAHEWAETQRENGKLYTVLVIITDGIVSDLEDMIAAIVDAREQPLSIVIIGLGDGDFREMDVLRGRNKRLSSRGVTMERDMVHFVTFRNFRSRPYSVLGAEALVEIPRHFVEWADRAGVHP
jgi:hypothetical protein